MSGLVYYPHSPLWVKDESEAKTMARAGKVLSPDQEKIPHEYKPIQLSLLSFLKDGGPGEERAAI